MKDLKKFNNEKKPPVMKALSLTRLQEGISKVIDYGDNKYARGNYHNAGSDMLDTYISATLRHLMAVCEARESGNTSLMNDSESGLPHLWHAAASLGIALQCQNKESSEE